MPLFESTKSAIKSRFGFHQNKQPEAGEESGLRPSRSFSSVEFSSKPDDAETVVPRSFEFREDPSFWKEHNVQVIIRVRPLNTSEISLHGHNRCVKQDSSQSVTWLGHPESRFTFDGVADENVSQEMVFKVAGVPMVDNCMEGYNSCMFAYGQTGSGKTHTMLGDIEGGTRRHSVNCGMTPRVFEYLFSRIQKDKDARREENLKFTCKCSFLEIYNEQILDLLDPTSSNLQLREDTKKGVYVENLTEVEVTSARDMIQQLLQGAANRKVAATNMNRASSRSHSVFTCIVESKWETQGVTRYRFARLNLVDLAGSERQKSSGAEGERLKEATNINKSLSTLGLVIMNLVSVSNGKSQHIPYRDSKLTFLLQDSLGGNAKTTIIANISPSSCCSLETLSTLKFAQRAKFIKNHAIVNEDASGDVLALKHEIQVLKKENSHLRSLVKGGAEGCDGDGLSLNFPGSPGPWDGLQGFSTPLLTEKKPSRLKNKEYEVALVGAFRREKEKDIALQTLEAEIKATLQLVKQREDEIQALKMQLRFREAGIKRLEAVASGKSSVDPHLIKEKEEHLKVIEELRSQVDRNQNAARFAMENLRLQEEIRRLKSFCEDGEQDRMNEQITILKNKLLEALDWKLMHESEPANMQNDVHSDINLLSSNQDSASPWRTTMNEENEFLRMQAIQNQSELDSLRKEKEKLERHANDLVKELEVERLSKLATTEQGQKGGSEVAILSDQGELKTMVDAIAAASEREADLSKENDELRMKLKVLVEDNNKLIELYDTTVAENNNKAGDSSLNPPADPIEDQIHRFTATAELKELEGRREVDSLKCQLAEMHEENDKLLSLYEKAMLERDEFKRVIGSAQLKSKDDKGDFSCPEKLVEIDGGQCLTFGEVSSVCPDGEFEPKVSSFGPYVQKGNDDSDMVKIQFNEVSVQSEHSLGSQMNDYSDAYETNEQSLAENVRRCVSEPVAQDMEIDEFEETQLEMQEKSTRAVSSDVCENLNSIRKKLVEAQADLSYTTQAKDMFCMLEKAAIEVDELTEKICKLQSSIQGKENESAYLRVLCPELQERKDVANKKLLALKNSLKSFSCSLSYFEQREAATRSKLDVKKKLNSLQVAKHELMDTLGKYKETEAELANSIESLMLKLEDGNRKLESDRVLIAIDNVEKTSNDHNWRMSTTELLKTEEEKTNLQNQMKLKSEKLIGVKNDTEVAVKKLSKIDSEIQLLKTKLEKYSSLSVEEMEDKLQRAVREREMLSEVNENGREEFGNMVVEYFQCLFEAELKEEEKKLMEEELVVESRRLNELKAVKDEALRKMTQLAEATACESRSLCDKMESEVHSIGQSVVELNSLLEQCS